MQWLKIYYKIKLPLSLISSHFSFECLMILESFFFSLYWWWSKCLICVFFYPDTLQSLFSIVRMMNFCNGDATLTLTSCCSDSEHPIPPPPTLSRSTVENTKLEPSHPSTGHGWHSVWPTTARFIYKRVAVTLRSLPLLRGIHSGNKLWLTAHCFLYSIAPRCLV